MQNENQSQKENVITPSSVIPASSSVIPAPLSNGVNSGRILSSLLFIFLLFIVVLGVGIFLGKTYFSSSPKENSGISSTPTLAVVPTATEATSGAEMTASNAAVANWKIYISEKYNYLFKYPDSVTIEKFPDPYDLNSERNYLHLTKYAQTILIVANPKSYSSTVPDYQENFDIAGVKGYRKSLSGGQNPAQENLFFKKDNLYFSLQLIPKDEESLKLFDQILSTFKFTESAK